MVTGSKALRHSWRRRTDRSRSCTGRKSPSRLPPRWSIQPGRSRQLRILLATDAWTPQVNGVVMTLRNTIRGVERAGHVVETIGPDRFHSIACPTYPEIRLALRP